ICPAIICNSSEGFSANKYHTFLVFFCHSHSSINTLTHIFGMLPKQEPSFIKLSSPFLRATHTEISMGNVGANGERFLFDACARHTTFWELLRDHQWDALSSMFTKKSLLYYDDRIVVSKENILLFFQDLF